MLQKCANPTCTAKFRSLREGKLFLAENHTAEPGDHKLRREHFWLCSVCATQFTLRFDERQGMVTVQLPETARMHLAAAAD